MKKTILIFLTVVFLASTGWCGSVQNALKGVISKKNTPVGNWYDGADKYCGWEEGSDELNTDATNEIVWDGDNGTDNSRVTSGQLQGTASYQLSGTAGSYVYEGTGGVAAAAIRLRVKITASDGLGDSGDNYDFAAIGDAGGAHMLFQAEFYNNATALSIRIRTVNAAGTAVVLDTVAVDLNTEYQIEAVYENAAENSWVGYKIYATGGGAPIDSAERTSDVYAANATSFYAGQTAYSVNSAITILVDNYYYKAQDTYIGPE